MDLLEEEETCEVVPSPRGRDMLIIRNYLMWWHKSFKAASYWRCRECQSRSCKGRAVTRLSDTGKYVLIKCSDHNHPPNAHEAAKLSNVKKKTKNTVNLPVQLTQPCITSVSLDISPSMPLNVDVHQKITRFQRHIEKTIVKTEVCSNHFVDGAPSITNPIPTLNIDPHPKEKESRNKSSNNLNLSFNLKPYKSLIADLNKTQEDYEKQQQQQQKIGPLREPPQRSATTVLEEVQCIDDEPRNEKILKAMLYQRSQSQNKSAPKLNVSAALGKPANNERIRKTPLNAASTSSNNSTLSSQPIEIENDSPPAKKPREIHIDIDVSEDESPPKPFIQPAIEPPVQKSMKSTAALPPSSVARNPVLDVNVHQKQKRILVVPNHHQSVMSNLSSLWKAGRLCDAFISNGAVNVKVHKMILGAVCPKVLDVFYNTPQHKLPKVTFPSSVSKEGLLAFAEYMYNGVLDLDPDLLFQMKIIAQRLDMKDFEQLCSNQLKPFMVANTLPTILEPMLSEPCSSSGLLQQMSSQSQSLQTTSRIERISSSKRAYQKGAHVDSLNSISTTADCSTNISLSNLPLVEVRTESDDMLMEVINNDLAPPSISDNIGDVNINERTSIKIEKVEHEQHYGNEFASSSIDYSTSDNINTSNFTHLPHTAISSQSQSSPSTTSKSPHTNNTTVTKPLPADEIWTATSKDQGDLVGNVKSDDPYPIGLFTSNWANVPLHTQDIKKEYTVE